MAFLKWRLFLILLGVLPMLSISAQSDVTAENAPYRVVGYYPSWGVYARSYWVTDIPGSMLTHINYAFANFHEDGQVVLGDPTADTASMYPEDTLNDPNPLRGNMRQLQRLKAANPGLQTLISIGGWNWSARFSDVALTPELRATFAASAVDFMIRYGFDGVDIDWEYPTGGGHPLNHTDPHDPENFVLLLEALRARLDQQGEQDGRHYLLTIAVTAGRERFDNIDWLRAAAAVDWLNIMAYDMVGSYSDATGFDAPLFNPAPADAPEEASVDSAVQMYLDVGIPSNQIVVGVPFYGRGFAEVPPENNGLHQPFGSLPMGTWDSGIYDYNDLVENYLPTYQRFWDYETDSPWLYNPDTGIMITYDDPESVAAKMAYIRDNELGGAMFWDLSGDVAPDDPNSR